MRFSFTDEQQEFRGIVRRFLQDKSPTSQVRRVMETEQGCDEDVWRQLAGELGLTAVHIPEAYGGQGFGVGELSIAVEEMGRSLLCAPYFSSTVLATTAILKAASEAQKLRLLPALAAGETRATLAVTEASGRWEIEATTTTATASAGKFVLEGDKSFVLDGHSADLLVVLARRPGSVGGDGLSLFAVSGDSKGLARRPLEVMDPTRKLASVTFTGVEAELLGEEGAAADPLRQTLDIAAICLANEMIGGADRLREDAIEFANMRVQFGRPIASFQALKHKAADLLMNVELAKSAAYYAAAAVDEGDPEVPALASIAKAAASEAYMQAAIDGIQFHGGIGFTWDNDTQLWFKRAKSSEVFLGTPAWHRERLMQIWKV